MSITVVVMIYSNNFVANLIVPYEKATHSYQFFSCKVVNNWKVEQFLALRIHVTWFFVLQEVELEGKLEELATKMAPLYQQMAPEAYSNQVCLCSN